MFEVIRSRELGYAPRTQSVHNAVRERIKALGMVEMEC